MTESNPAPVPDPVPPVIPPTVGRIVHYYSDAHMGPYAAIIAGVETPNSVNLAVFDFSGNWHSRTNVPLVQAGEPVPSGRYCTWMPYQVGQAAKTEQLQAQLAASAPTTPEPEPEPAITADAAAASPTPDAGV